VELKDLAISQTGDVADSIEALEAMADVRDQMQQMAHTFARMRNWVTEIVAFEPVINRAMRSLQPLMQLGNLRRMDPAELRQVLRTMSERNEAQFTGEQNVDALPTLGEKPAAPALNEAALAQ
jgi:tRNA C32,U32 (ribose-2'-O)-methylase TrmJ